MADEPSGPIGASDEVVVWHLTTQRADYPALSFRVATRNHKIRLHLTATLSLPAGARVRPPPFAYRFPHQLFPDLFERADEFLDAFLRPARAGRQ